MSTPEACPRKKELVPLEEIQNRPEVMERCFGPVFALGAISVFDAYRKQGLQIDREWLTTPSVEMTLSLPYGITNIGHTMENSMKGYGDFQDALAATAPEDRRKIQTQKQLIDRFMFYGAESLTTSMRVSIHDQTHLLGKIILPGVLSKRELPITNVSVCKILRSEELDRICKSLSFSANGAWATPSMISVDNILQTPQTELQQYAMAHGDLEHELLTPINLSRMFKMSEKSGQVVVSDIAVKVLRKYMKLDNTHGITNNDSNKISSPGRLNGSRGCPASIKSIRMRLDDLTQHQMERLIGGDNPIASYDEGEQIFTLLRSPITELNLLFSDILNPLYSQN